MPTILWITPLKTGGPMLHKASAARLFLVMPWLVANARPI